MSNYRVLVPDCIIRNENGINLKPKDFAIFCVFKMYYDKQKTSNIKIDHHALMCKVGVRSNPTFKSCLDRLYKSKLIINNIGILPKHEMLEVNLNEDVLKRKPFTMHHVNLLYNLQDFGCEGLRLLYYYESRINRNKYLETMNGVKVRDNQFCFAGVRLISKETKININKISGINKRLKELNLLDIKQHELKKHDETFNDVGETIVTKFNNHYSPLLKNIQKYKSG